LAKFPSTFMNAEILARFRRQFPPIGPSFARRKIPRFLQNREFNGS
jgi:hypothetical protein